MKNNVINAMFAVVDLFVLLFIIMLIAEQTGQILWDVKSSMLGVILSYVFLLVSIVIMDITSNSYFSIALHGLYISISYVMGIIVLNGGQLDINYLTSDYLLIFGLVSMLYLAVINILPSRNNEKIKNDEG